MNQFAHRVPLLFPALFFLLVIGLVEAVIFTYKGRLASEARVQALTIAADLRDNAEQELNKVLDLTRGLTSYFSVRYASLEREEILDILRVAHETSPMVRNFGVAVGYELTYLYPREGNEEAVGLDYRELEAQWPDVERAVETQAAVLSERVALRQGGEAFIYRDPIYIDERYWGLLSTVIEARPLLEAMFGGMEGNNRHRFAVRAGEKTPLWGDASLFQLGNTVSLASERGWEFVVETKSSETHWLPTFVLRILGWILALVSGMGIYAIQLARSRNG